MDDRRILQAIFKKLLNAYGPRKWWPARTRFEVIVGAILTQNVSWRNAKLAVNSLKKARLLSPSAILVASHEEIAPLIKSSRFYNQKTEKLKAFCAYFMHNYNGSLDKMFSGDMESLRRELLGLKGVGKETADSILLYAGRKLSFVSDAYTKRFLKRYGLNYGSTSYEGIRSFFMKNLPKDLYLYNEYHALIVHHGNAVCRAKPDCNGCPISHLSRKIFCSHYYGSK